MGEEEEGRWCKKGSEGKQNKRGKVENQAVKQERGTGNVTIWSGRVETQRLRRDEKQKRERNGGRGTRRGRGSVSPGQMVRCILICPVAVCAC